MLAAAAAQAWQEVQQGMSREASSGARAVGIGQAGGDVIAEGGVATRQRQDAPGAARAERLAHRDGRLAPPLDAGQADPQAEAASSGTAEALERTQLDQAVNARAADAEAARRLRRRQTLVCELI